MASKIKRLFSHTLLLLEVVDFRFRMLAFREACGEPPRALHLKCLTCLAAAASPSSHKLNDLEGKKRLPSPFTLCLSGLNKPLSLFGLSHCSPRSLAPYTPINLSVMPLKKTRKQHSFRKEPIKMKKCYEW
jgi:hypothetical protein